MTDDGRYEAEFRARRACPSTSGRSDGRRRRAPATALRLGRPAPTCGRRPADERPRRPSRRLARAGGPDRRRPPAATAPGGATRLPRSGRSGSSPTRRTARDHRSVAGAARRAAPAPPLGRRGAPRHAARLLPRRPARREQHQERTSRRDHYGALRTFQLAMLTPMTALERRSAPTGSAPPWPTHSGAARPRTTPSPRSSRPRSRCGRARSRRRSRCASTSPATPWTRSSGRRS